MHRLMLACVSIVFTLATFAVPALAETKSLNVGVKRHMGATLIAPDAPGPYPGVLILHTSGGLDRADLDYAKRLSEQGYVCLVPAFMEAYGITAKTRVQTFTSSADDVYGDLVNAIAVLRASDKVAGAKVGAVGFSNGGYFAVWLAATGKVDAGVSYYGALSGAGSDRELTRFKSVFTGNSSPVLILHGTEDRTVPIGAAKRLVSILDAAKTPNEVRLYDDVDHRFDRDARTDAMKAAALDAWSRTLTFLGATLRSR